MGWPVCNSSEEKQSIDEVDLWDGGITFHHLALIVGGAFAIVAGLVSFYLIMGHATHYSRPVEQRHIIRILLMVPIYSLVSWLCIFFHKHSVYFSVIGDCYEAFTIAAFFALLCHYIAPDLHSQKNYFRGIKPRQWVWPVPWMQKCCGGQNGIWRIPRSGLTWFNVIWIGIFQYCLLRVLMTIVAVLTQHFNLYCEASLSPAFSHVWVMVVECIAVTIAMYCLIQYYIQIKDDIREHSPFLKILSIKLVIFLSFWQSTLISFLFSSGAIKASSKIETIDWKVGLPNLLICIEMAIFSVLHQWAFAWQVYSIERVQDSEVADFYGNGKVTYQGGFWGFKALFDALNPLDLLKAVCRGFRWLFVGRKKRTLDPSYQVPFEQIGLDHDDRASGTSVTAYQGAGPLMAGGRPLSPEEDGKVLLSHAQPNPTTPEQTHNRLGLTPSPYEEDPLNQPSFSHDNRLHDSSMLDATGPSPRPYSPYDDTYNNPYMAPYDAQHDLYQQQQNPYHHHRNVSDPHETDPTTRLYHTDGLHEQQEHGVISMPDPYQPPPLHDDYDHGRRY